MSIEEVTTERKPPPVLCCRWEYHVELIVPNHDQMVSHLNRLGDEGWELVGMPQPVQVQQSTLATSAAPGLMCMFKRPKMSAALVGVMPMTARPQDEEIIRLAAKA